MGDTGSDIIIKGTSVTLEFDETVYRKQNGDPKKYKNETRKITRIQVLDDTGAERFVIEDNAGLRWTVNVITK